MIRWRLGAVALAFSLACSPAPPAPAALGSGPLDVSVTLEEAARAGAEIGAEGGTLSAAARDGTRFTLELPKGALAQPTRITMTPVAAIAPFPFSKGLVGAVQLEPEGLDLAVPALLTIAPAAPVSLEARQGFSYYGSGQDFHLYPLQRDPERLWMKLSHFSGGGVGRATDADRQQQANRTPRSPEAQLWQRVAAELARERFRQIVGAGSEEGNAELARLMTEAVSATLARALAECDSQTLLRLTRMGAIIGASWVSDAQAKEFDEKCNRLSLSFDSTIIGGGYQARAVIKNALVRDDGKGNLVGTAMVELTFSTPNENPCITDPPFTHQEQIPVRIQVIGGTASPSPTLLLSFPGAYDAPTLNICQPEVGDAANWWLGFFGAFHRMNYAEQSVRVTGWTHAGDGPARSWSKSFSRRGSGIVPGLNDDMEERTTIELRREPAK